MAQWGDPKPSYTWPVAVAQPIAAPAHKVWEVVSMPGNLEHCHLLRLIKSYPSESQKVVSVGTHPR